MSVAFGIRRPTRTPTRTGSHPRWRGRLPRAGLELPVAQVPAAGSRSTQDRTYAPATPRVRGLSPLRTRLESRAGPAGLSTARAMARRHRAGHRGPQCAPRSGNGTRTTRLDAEFSRPPTGRSRCNTKDPLAAQPGARAGSFAPLTRTEPAGRRQAPTAAQPG
jgi:hypothetical protein